MWRGKDREKEKHNNETNLKIYIFFIFLISIVKKLQIICPHKNIFKIYKKSNCS